MFGSSIKLKTVLSNESEVRTRLTRMRLNSEFQKQNTGFFWNHVLLK